MLVSKHSFLGQQIHWTHLQLCNLSGHRGIQYGATESLFLYIQAVRLLANAS